MLTIVARSIKRVIDRVEETNSSVLLDDNNVYVIQSKKQKKTRWRLDEQDGVLVVTSNFNSANMNTNSDGNSSRNNSLVKKQESQEEVQDY